MKYKTIYFVVFIYFTFFIINNFITFFSNINVLVGYYLYYDVMKKNHAHINRFIKYVGVVVSKNIIKG